MLFILSSVLLNAIDVLTILDVRLDEPVADGKMAVLAARWASLFHCHRPLAGERATHGERDSSPAAKGTPGME
jgi:hypothetical protein